MKCQVLIICGLKESCFYHETLLRFPFDSRGYVGKDLIKILNWQAESLLGSAYQKLTLLFVFSNLNANSLLMAQLITSCQFIFNIQMPDP